jgi:DNA-binding NtrC family response regulator
LATILCIDDEAAVGVVLGQALTALGHEPVLAASVDEGLKALAQQQFDLIVSDYRMPEASGLDLLDRLRELAIDVPVIIMTGFASIEHAVRSIRHGAVDYLSKPLRAEAIRIAVTNAIEVNRLRRENEEFRREIHLLRGSNTIVGDSPALRHVLEMVATVAPTNATVLLSGESGTGKELLARAIHEQSPRHGQPLVTVNCAALPEGLVESALFGHERGAFTGATARNLGAFERANRGTLLLDEISEMRLDLQSKLLRAIQEQEVERVGGSQPIKVDTRLIATSNRDLLAEVDAGRFRRDLYYRLNVVPIHSPALRERAEDIPLLVEHFVLQASLRLGIRAPEVPAETLDFLVRQPWPGNIRELQNAVERAVILRRNDRLTIELFGLPGTAPPPAAAAVGGAAAAAAASLPLDLGELERITIARALERTGGHRAKAAELLGISERTLRNKLNTRPGESE